MFYLSAHQFRSDGCLAYLLADPGASAAALVDPRADAVELYLKELSERGLKLVAVLETHTHADHMSGAAELRRRTGAEVYISKVAVSDVATQRVGDGDHIQIGSIEIGVLASPGHTDDSVAYLAGDALLSGDALLIGGAGRTDFQNGSPAELHDTLFRRFAKLPGTLRVWPGHDYQGRNHSTLEEERRSNPLYQLAERERFVAALSARPQPKPADMDAILLANRRGAAALRGIEAEALARALRGEQPPVVVDVRFPFEYRAAHIEPSQLVPLDELERRAHELPAQRELVLVCRTGARARLAAEKLTGRQLRVLEGGLDAWRGAGLPVLEGKKHMSLERQVRVLAGGLAAVAGVLAVVLSPWWGLGASFIGLGLVYAGITDRCGMAMVLGKLPWNKIDAEPASGSCAAACAAAIETESVR